MPALPTAALLVHKHSGTNHKLLLVSANLPELGSRKRLITPVVIHYFLIIYPIRCSAIAGL
jgi:hypothetical protein